MADVGERPTPKHQLRRKNPAEPWSKENAQWLAAIGSSRSGRTKDEQSAYGREWNLRQKFGIDSAIYNKMLQDQNEACAICLEPEIAIHHRTGFPRALAVDHDHDTDAVRGLLCRDCNTALGLFDEDVVRLRAAIAYLEHHAVDSEPVSPQ